MNIKYVTPEDKDFWLSIDKHTSHKQFEDKILKKSGYVMWENGIPVGLLHFCTLWDNLPFLNFIFVPEEFRGNGFGKEAMLQWEQKMKEQGFKMVLISTQVNEEAQHFYRKLGYVDCGGLVLHNTPFEQPMEMFMRKIL